jgi:septin family protein
MELPVAKIVEPELAVQKFEFPSDVNRFLNPFAMLVAGPTMCGKSTFILEILKNQDQLLRTKFSQIVYRCPASDLHSDIRQAFIKKLTEVIPAVIIKTGLPEPGDFTVNNLPKLFILGKKIHIKLLNLV